MWWRRTCREVGVTEEDIMDRLRWTPNERRTLCEGFQLGVYLILSL